MSARLAKPADAPAPEVHAETQRVLLMGAYGQDNLGDEAILEVHLQELAGFHVTVVSTNPAQTSERYGVPSVQTYGGDRMRTLGAFRASDVLVYGGGSLLKELKPPYFRYRLVTNLTAATMAAKAAGKGVAFSAMGVERLPSPLGRALARRAAAWSDLFLVRDEGSRQKLRDIGAACEAHVTADPAYLLREDERAGARADVFFGPFAGRPVVALNPICSSEVARPREEVARAFAALANHLHRTSDAHVLLLPFKTKGEDNDVDILEDVTRHLEHPERATTAPLDLRPSELVAFLRRSACFVGMRHHGVLLALVARCPLIPVPYAEKTENLVAEFGLTPYAVPAHALTPEALLAAHERVAKERDAVLAACEAPMAAMAARATDNFDRLRAFIRARGAA